MANEFISFEENSVIIPYNLWHEKYKPLAEKNNELQRQLLQKEVTLILRFSYGQYKINNAVGTFKEYPAFLDPEIHVGSTALTVLEIKKERFHTLVNSAIDELLRQENTEGSARKVVWRDQYEKWQKAMEEKIAYTEGMEKHRQEYMRKTVEENKRIIAGIPKWLRWLFKIKNI